MSTVIFFNVPAHCHVNPTLPLVAELIKRGEQVIYYSQEEFRPVIEQTGALFRAYGDAYPFDHNRLDENIFKVVNQMMQASWLILAKLEDEIRASKPDYIIHDSLCPWGLYFAQLLNIPSIRSIVIFAINVQLALSTPSQYFEHIRMIFAAWKEVLGIIRMEIKIGQSYHVGTYIDCMNILQNVGPMKILYASRQFQPFADRFDDTYKFIGYPISPRTHAPSFPFEALSDKRLLYISLGTIYNDHLEFYRQCFDAFENSEWQVVMSVGNKVTVESLEPIPANFIVRNTVPQLEILQRASLFLSAGGSSSVKEACNYGVPLIIIPHASDQSWVATRIEQLGIGKRVHKRKVTASLLRKLADEIVANPNYAQASARIGESLREAGGYTYAVDEIQRLKQKHAHQLQESSIKAI